MDDVNGLVEAARLLREAAEDVEKWPVDVHTLGAVNARDWLATLGFADAFVARQIADWLEAEAEAALAAGEHPLGAALDVAEKVRR